MRGSFSNVGGSRASAAARKGQKVGSLAVRMRGVVAAAAFGVLFMGACTDEDATVDTLRASGFTNIRTTGYEWFSCGENKGGTCTGFEATGPTGVRVHGAVSCGFWSCSKGCTVRVEAVR